MPTYDEDPQVMREYLALSPDRQHLFRRALRLMVEDLKNKRPFRASLRVKGVQGHPGIFEMTWEMPNGRATFTYGQERSPGDPHIIWRRTGGHDILQHPLVRRSSTAINILRQFRHRAGRIHMQPVNTCAIEERRNEHERATRTPTRTPTPGDDVTL